MRKSARLSSQTLTAWSLGECSDDWRGCILMGDLVGLFSLPVRLISLLQNYGLILKDLWYAR